MLAGLDLVGVLLIGLVGLLAATAATGQAVPSPVLAVVDFLGMGSMSTATMAAVLGAIAAVVLVLKSVISLLIQRKLALFLARRSVDVGKRLIGGFLSQSLLEVQKRPDTWNSYAFVDGLNSLTGVLSQYMVIVGDASVLIVLGGALLLLDPVTTLVTGVYFAVVVWAMTRWLGRWSSHVTRTYAGSSIATRQEIHNAIVTYRESTVAGRRDFFRQEYLRDRWVNAKSAADISIIGSVPRFGMEAALVLGAVVLVVALVLTGKDLADAVGSLALFMAAVARVMPSMLRINAGFVGIHSAAAGAERTLELFSEVRDVPVRIPAVVDPSDTRWGPYEVDIRNVCLNYPDREQPALWEVSLYVPAGRSLALVGPTGSGKSSLADIILGVVPPTSGSVLIGGLTSSDMVRDRAGSLAYVPQNVAIVHGTIRDNVGLGLWEIDDERVWRALERAHLAEFVRSQDAGIETLVGDRGVRLSGGQRQRLGLARALYTIPSVLVLDEATSALDAETEHAIADTIGSLGSQVTTITVAHRLATIRSADQVAYLREGRLAMVGSFEDVRSQVPSFERQARLLGL